MEKVYWVCAVVGGTVMIVQFLLTLLGLGDHGDHDVGGGHDFGGGDHGAGGHDAGHGTNWFFAVLSIRTIVAGLTFFGLTGMALQQAGSMDETSIAACALAAGAAAVMVVYWSLRWLSNLNADGTTYIDQTVGATGTVYLSIPGEKAGAGKVHVTVGNRRVEYKAMTPYANLPTGTPIVVLGVIDSGTVEVASLESVEAAGSDQG